MKRPQSVTLKDIAAATGYSVNTVSRALRDKDDIAEATRENIQKVAVEMGHVSNDLASSLRTGYTNTIAVILGDVSNPHFGVMMKEMEQHARARGYMSFLLNSGEDEQQEQQAIQLALNKNVDGVLLCPAQHSEANLRGLLARQLPFVQVGRHFTAIDAPYVVCNDEMGGYQATAHLLASGHRDILMLNGPDYISSARERLAGYRRAHAEYGLPLRQAYIRPVPVTSGAGSAVAEALRQVREEKLPFSAIFCFSDVIAWDAWTYLESQGLRVPQDCSLVGFDNIQSRLAIPHPLTSISTFKKTISTTAVDCLVALMEQRRSRRYTGPLPESQVIDTRLAPGTTVALRG